MLTNTRFVPPTNLVEVLRGEIFLAKPDESMSGRNKSRTFFRGVDWSRLQRGFISRSTQVRILPPRPFRVYIFDCGVLAVV